jgi:CubicO group peptidase (beta-lactamase class C family)
LECLEGRVVLSVFSGTSSHVLDYGPGQAAALIASQSKAQAAVAPKATVSPKGVVSNTAWVARHGMTAAQYQAQFNTLVGQGYRLIDVSGYEVGGQARYAAIWDKSSGPAWAAFHGLTSAQYQAQFNTLVRQGYRPVHVSGYTVAGQAYYAAIFQKSSGVAWQAFHGLTGAQFQANFNTLVAQGYRLVDVSGYGIGGQDYYTAIFDKSSGPAWEAHNNMTSAQYQAQFNRLAGLGYQLTEVSGYSVNGQDRYAAIWQKTSGVTWEAHHGMTSAQYQAQFTNLVNQGYRLVDVSGYTVGGQDRYAAIWQNLNYSAATLQAINNDVAKFMQQYSVPGASIAIAKDDRLVYAHGFGVADKTTGDAVTVNSLFRIASVSKPITSAAIFTLVDQGRLRLSDKVFGKGGILGTQYGTKPYSSNVQKITVQNLLEHTAGGWSNDANDPMFSNPGMNQSQLISWVLDNRPLDHVPGTTYAYSNFGYCVLGRIIEKVTGQSYASYVQSAVLGPSGITDMAIAGNTLAARRANEVRYYGQGGEDPYSMQVTRMDSHGGWLASASDLLRFAVRVDGKPGKADILSSASIKQMTTPSTANPGYAKGWQVNTVPNWWHTGSLPGTGTILVRTASGFTWSALLNTRSLNANFFSDLDNLMWKVVGEVKSWPTYDLWA